MTQYPRPDDDRGQMTFLDLFRFVRRGLLLALLAGAAAAAAAFYLARVQEPVFQARATVLMARGASDLQSFGASLVTAPPLDPGAYRAAALSESRIVSALEASGTSSPTDEQIRQLLKSTTVSVQDERLSALLHFDVRANDPDEAAALATGMAEALVSWDKERATANLQQIIDALESQIAALDQQIANLGGVAVAAASEELAGRVNLRAERQDQLYYARTLLNSAVGLLSILEPARAPRNPVAPVPLRDAALAFVLGVLLVYGLLLLRDALDTRLRGSDDVARTSGLPVLAEFPRMPKGSRRLPRESSGYLRTNLMFAAGDAHPKVLLITSSLGSEGKSSIALSLAESFARNDHRTLLVDADLRKPVLAREYGLGDGRIEGAEPLAAWLQHPHEPHVPTQIVLGSGIVMDLVPSYEAAPNPTELLSQGFLTALEQWRGEYDVIVIDSAPVLPVADTLTIAPLCTGTILAASVSTTDRRRLASSSALLKRIGVRLLGAVTTQVEGRTGKKADELGYGYGYGYGTPPEVAPVRAARSSSVGRGGSQRAPR